MTLFYNSPSALIGPPLTPMCAARRVDLGIDPYGLAAEIGRFCFLKE